MKLFLTILFSVILGACSAQIITKIDFDSNTSIQFSFHRDSTVYIDTVTCRVIYMVNDSTIKVIKTRVVQSEKMIYMGTDNYGFNFGDAGYIDKTIHYIDINEAMILKAIDLQLPEHLHVIQSL